MTAQKRSKRSQSNISEKQLEEVLGTEEVNWLRQKEVLQPFARLVGWGCDSSELWWGLGGIRLAYGFENPRRGEIRIQATGSGYPAAPEHQVVLFPAHRFEAEMGFDRSELKTVIKRMRQCADDLKRLNIHTISQILSEESRFLPATGGRFPRVEGRPSLGDVLSELNQLYGYADGLPWRVRVLALATEEGAKHIYLRDRPLYDSNVASIVRYVRQRTRQFRDEEVSALIAAVTERPNYDAVAHRDWRKRNRRLLE